MMIDHDYIKKPSITTLRAALRKAAARGGDFIQFTWGENQITVERFGGSWVGRGWIGRNGGQDLANELEVEERKFGSKAEEKWV